MSNIISLKHNIVNDEYTKYIYEAYDIQNREQTIVEIENNIVLPDDFNWNIGVIYGGSGSGKTTLLKTFGTLNEPIFSDCKSLISNYDWLTPEDACGLLTAMGLASVPTWLRPYSVLSNGEQYRARLAYVVGKAKLGEVVLIDEFTSVVDRDVACAMSNAIQKYIRRTGKKIVLASCHFDIMDWLIPDWVYSPNKRRTEVYDYRRRSRPKIRLEICRCRYETWHIFKQHHYLTSDLNKASKCFMALWNGKPVAFFAILPFPNGSFKDAFRGSRSVVLPDYQGLGIGNAVTTYLASLYKKLGYSYYVRTSNPALVNARRNSMFWEECGNSGVDRRGQTMFSEGVKSFRTAYSFKYSGYPSYDNTDIVKMKNDSYRDTLQSMDNLFNKITSYSKRNKFTLDDI